MITHVVTVLWKFCVVKELTDIYILWVEILNAPSVTIAFLRSLTETHEKEVMSG